MALYRVGDIVQYESKVFKDRIYDSEILFIREDSPEESRVIYDIRRVKDSLVTSISSRQIVKLIGGPRYNIVEDPVEDPIPQQAADYDYFFVNNRKQDDYWNKFFLNNLGADNPKRHAIEYIPVPAPAPAQDPVAVPEENRIIMPNGRIVPIVFHQGIRDISVEDYHPNIDSRRMVTFAFNKCVVHPYLVGKYSAVLFEDEKYALWVNSLQVQFNIDWVVNRDSNNVSWMSFNEYTEVTRKPWESNAKRADDILKEIASGKPGKVEIKKLRHKYEKMPIIHEEEYYAGKEFIA